MPQKAPKLIDPDNKYFIIRSPDNQGEIIGKYETNAPTEIPKRVGNFVVVELSGKDQLDGYAYNHAEGFQT